MKHSRFLLNLVLVFVLDGGAFALSRPYYRLHSTWKSIRHKESFTSCIPANLINFIITIFSCILMFSNTGPPNSCRNSQLDSRGGGQLNRIVYNGAPVWKSILHSPRNLFINAKYPSLETRLTIRPVFNGTTKFSNARLWSIVNVFNSIIRSF